MAIILKQGQSYVCTAISYGDNHLNNFTVGKMYYSPMDEHLIDDSGKPQKVEDPLFLFRQARAVETKNTKYARPQATGHISVMPNAHNGEIHITGLNTSQYQVIMDIIRSWNP